MKKYYICPVFKDDETKEEFFATWVMDELREEIGVEWSKKYVMEKLKKDMNELSYFYKNKTFLRLVKLVVEEVENV